MIQFQYFKKMERWACRFSIKNAIKFFAKSGNSLCMICPKCNFEQAGDGPECLRCGVIFAKVHAASTPADGNHAVVSELGEMDTDERFGLRQILLPEPADPNPLTTAGRALLLVVLLIWSFKFIFANIESNVVGQSFLHLVNLPFHEAGHIVFSIFGRFIQVLGGTLAQLLMPAICMAVLLFKTRDAFGAAVAQWWLAESFMDIAPYINDARALKLVLLGGVTGQDVVDYHDWEYILRKLGMLRMDHALAYSAQGLGIVLMVSALVWMALNVWVDYRHQRVTLKYPQTH